MYFVLPTPSQQHLAAVKIVAHLWTQPDIFTQIEQLYNRPYHGNLSEYSTEWKEMAEKVRSKISALQLSPMCIKQLLNVVKPLGIEIIHWGNYHREQRYHELSGINLLPPQFCWTMHGAIDYAKTAELLMKDERLTVESRYELACINCFEDEARQLLESMDEKQRRAFVLEFSNFFSPHRNNNLIIFYSRNQFPTMFQHEGKSSSNKRLFEDTLPSGNRAMCEYLFNNFNLLEKRRVLKSNRRLINSCRESPTRNLLYYLSLMNGPQQRRMFRESMVDVLRCLLRWPLQSLFMTAVQFVWRFVDEAIYSVVMSDIADSKDFDRSRLFWECWRMSSDDYKEYFLSDIGNAVCLIHTKEEEFIRLLFNEAPAYSVLVLLNEYDDVRHILMDERVISDATLMEWKEEAALISSNEEEDEEKRSSNRELGVLIDIVMDNRIEIRRKKIEKSLMGKVQGAGSIS